MVLGGGDGWAARARLWEGGAKSVFVVILDSSIHGRSRYLYIMLGGYMRILGAPSVQSCYTLSIAAS